MPLQHAKPRRYVTGDVIDHLGPRAERAPEKYTTEADKRFDISAVIDRSDTPDDASSEILLATFVDSERHHRIGGNERQVHCLLPQSPVRTGNHADRGGYSVRGARPRGLDRCNGPTPDHARRGPTGCLMVGDRRVS